MESIRGYFKALKWRSLIVAFSAILLGLLFILTPQTSADVICYVAGILLLASGIAAVISYLASGRLFGSYALVSGIVLLVCGVFCLLRPEIIQGLLTVLFGVFLVIDGMMTLQEAWTARGRGLQAGGSRRCWARSRSRWAAWCCSANSTPSCCWPGSR